MFAIAIILAVVGLVLFVGSLVCDDESLILGAIACLIGAGLFVLTGAYDDDEKARTAFMTQCLQDHKEYECVAMWRAGESHTQVAPMPVVVGR